MKTEPLFEPLSTLLNRQVERSTPARDAIAELEGCTLGIRLKNTALSLFLAVREGRVEISRSYDEVPDVVLETTPLGLAEMAQGTLSGGRMAMTGDPVVAQHFQILLQHTRPDWEEELSRVFGDVAAHHVGNVVRGLLDFGQRAAESLSRSTAEFVQEERRDIAAPSEIADFREKVEAVAARVAELASRVDRLQP